MTKDYVLKQRGEVFDAALRMERARLAIEVLNNRLEEARVEYGEAGRALSAARSKADASEAGAVQEVIKGEKVEAVLEVEVTR
jgi:hypothetical protein